MICSNNEHPHKEKLNNNGKIKKETLNTFQRRILGLTSYYTFDPRQFAKEIVHYENVLMSDYQKHIYEKFDSIENQINKNGMKNSMYKSLTRQSSNFVFPSVYSIDGLKRPRPNDFKISEKDINLIKERDPKQTYSIAASYKKGGIIEITIFANLYCNIFDISQPDCICYVWNRQTKGSQA